MADPSGGPVHRHLTNDSAVPHRVFLAIAGLVGVLAIIYWFTAYEDAGTVMLGLAAGLALWCGVYLWLCQRHIRSEEAEAVGPPAAARPPDATATEVEATYVPHASVWPFVMGVGAAALFNGVVLGVWVLAPGAALTVIGVGGFIRQSRHRD